MFLKAKIVSPALRNLFDFFMESSKFPGENDRF